MKRMFHLNKSKQPFMHIGIQFAMRNSKFVQNSIILKFKNFK